MRSIVFHMPDSVNITDKEALMAMASKLYESGKLSLGQAAEIVGYSKTTFMELLADYGVSVFNYSADDLSNELRDAEGDDR